MSIRLPQIENKTFFYSQRQKKRRHRRRKTAEELRAIFGDRTAIRFQFAPNSINRTNRGGSAINRSDRPVSAVSSSSGRTRVLSQSEEKTSSNVRPPSKKSALPSIHKSSASQPVSLAAAIAEELDLSLSETNLLLQAEQDREDTKQATFTFQEAKFAATGILSQLSVYLSRKLPPGEEFLSLTLIHSLQLGFSDLSRNVVIPSKKWQTDYYVDYETGRPFKKHPRSILKQLKSMKQQTSSKRSSRKTAFVDVKSDLSTTGSEVSDNEELPASSGLAILEYRRESRHPSIHFGTPRTRAEKHAYLTKPTDTVKKKAPVQLDVTKLQLTPDNVVVDVEPVNFQPGGGVLTFSLNPDTCSDDSWIVYPSNEEDPERHTLIELAKERLRAAIKSKRDLQIQAQQRQADGPLELKFYGERHMPAKLRSRKITLPRVTLSSSFVVTLQQEEDTGTDDTEGFKRKKFTLCLPDGSSTWFYPSGRIALQVCRGSYSHRCPYVSLFHDSDQAPMIASFTPDGRGCCYHDNGYLSLLFNQDGGMLMDKRGWIEKKWSWPPSNMKLPTSISLQLSYHFSLRCVSQGSMIVLFKCNGEIISTNVGYLPEQREEESSAVLTQATSSLTGAQHVRRRSKKHNKRLLDDSIDKFDIDLSIAEFQVYKDRIRNLVNDWLEFYRLALKINSPSPTPRSPSPEFGRYNRPTPVIWNFSTPPPNIPVGGTSRQSSRPPSRLSALPPALHSVGISTDGAMEHSRIYSPDQLASSMGVGDLMLMSEKMVEDAKSVSHSFHRRLVLDPMERNSCSTTLKLSISCRSVMENKCSCERKQKRRITDITDVEFDTFIKLHLPATQLCVVCIYSSKIPHSFVSEVMLNTLHYQHNKYRAAPCLDSDADVYRLFKYDLATAGFGVASRSIPLLVERHKAQPGMFFMYWGGRLVFADFVFNGYGNAQKDFSKQVRVTLRQAKCGQFLPDDFKFSSFPKRNIPSLTLSALTPPSSLTASNLLTRHSDSGVTLQSLLSLRDRPTAILT